MSCARSPALSGVARAFTNVLAAANNGSVPVYITEYDINVADDNRQKTIMQDEFTMFWNDPNVHGITIWGYIVGSTWETNSGLQQTDNTMRPAMSWLMGFLGR